MNTKMILFQRAIYKRSLWDRFRGKYLLEGRFHHASRFGIIYTENVGKYYSCYGIDLVDLDEHLTSLYYVVDDDFFVNAGNNVNLPKWMSMRWKPG